MRPVLTFQFKIAPPHLCFLPYFLHGAYGIYSYIEYKVIHSLCNSGRIHKKVVPVVLLWRTTGSRVRLKFILFISPLLSASQKKKKIREWLSLWHKHTLSTYLPCARHYVRPWGRETADRTCMARTLGGSLEERQGTQVVLARERGKPQAGGQHRPGHADVLECDSPPGPAKWQWWIHGEWTVTIREKRQKEKGNLQKAFDARLRGLAIIQEDIARS